MNKGTALVTGASGGIGSAIAEALAREGYNIAVHYNSDRDGALHTCSLVEKAGGRAAALQCDIADCGAVERMVEDTRILLGDITLLVNNAGVADICPFAETDPGQWQRMLDINLTGMYNCCHTVLPHMVRQYQDSGRQCGVVNISSVWGIYGASCEVAYSAAKAGVIGFTQALAKEYAPSGIRVNCVAPGCIETRMVAHLDKEALEDIIDRTPLGRLGRPEDTAAAVVFLASEGASFITGITLPVTGGFC